MARIWSALLRASPASSSRLWVRCCASRARSKRWPSCAHAARSATLSLASWRTTSGCPARLSSNPRALASSSSIFCWRWRALCAFNAATAASTAAMRRANRSLCAVAIDLRVGRLSSSCSICSMRADSSWCVACSRNLLASNSKGEALAGAGADAMSSCLRRSPSLGRAWAGRSSMLRSCSCRLRCLLRSDTDSACKAASRSCRATGSALRGRGSGSGGMADSAVNAATVCGADCSAAA